MDYYPPQADKGSSTIGGLRYKNLKRSINGRFFVFLNFFGMDYYPPQVDKGSSALGGLRYKNLKRSINGRFFFLQFFSM
jgi:hypothetical protein